MQDKISLQAAIRKHMPDAVIPEIEALDVDALKELETQIGQNCLLDNGPKNAV